jgi:acetoin utilization protein AcuB
MLMPPVSRYMTRQPWTTHRDVLLADAKELMRKDQIRHLPVLDGGTLVGIVSERDILRLERLEYLGNHFTVEDAMVDDVYAADVEQPVDEVVEAMADNKYGAAVVLNRRYAVEGIFTTVDGMQVLADVLRRAAA